MPKYITKTFSFNGKRYFARGKTEEEAIEKREKLRQRVENEVHVFNSSTRLREWALECVETYKTNQRAITRKVYLSRLNHCILEYMGGMKLQDIKPIDCQKVLNQQAGYSKSQIKEVRQIMNFIFTKAVENKLIEENPAAFLTLPSGYVHHRRALTASEEDAFLQCLREKYMVFALMYYLGLRPSEARNLKYCDRKKLDGMNVFHVHGTKTVNADRVVPIPNDLNEMLHKEISFEYVAKYKGQQVTAETIQTLWTHLKKEMDEITEPDQEFHVDIDMNDRIVPYCLRHTYCTNLAKKGVDIRTAQYLMGHSDINLTANIYTHIDNDTIKKAYRILNEI